MTRLVYVPEDVSYMQADGFESALLGVGNQFLGSEGQMHVAVYSFSKCVEVLMDRDGMEYAEAIEFMDYNVLGSYLGPGMPVFLLDLEI